MLKPILEAVVFDLDGVITDTAILHTQAWKKAFDAFLEKTVGAGYRPFTTEEYEKHVDGIPRYKGVQAFLEHRVLSLPYGAESDAPSMDTVCGLGNLKNSYYLELFERQGATVFQTSVDLIHALKAAGVKVAVASSSANCEAILVKAGLLHLFEVRVDGVVSKKLGLKGKPEPDIFTKAAELVGAQVKNSVVVEDAEKGVAAGRAGKFGLVIGVDRKKGANTSALIAHGADTVVLDLVELSVKGINELLIQRQKIETAAAAHSIPVSAMFHPAAAANPSSGDGHRYTCGV